MSESKSKWLLRTRDCGENDKTECPSGVDSTNAYDASHLPSFSTGFTRQKKCSNLSMNACIWVDHKNNMISIPTK